ncbi:MAG TPA: hypothetical protein VK601_10860 [Kofleriaceae bacterium]|nr:hypothetical protein [Kofleriaceae bacterium]
MTTTTATNSPASAASSTSSTLRPLTVIAGLVLAGFGAFSTWVVVTHGYTGFLALAGREPWALQMLLDLVIALSVAIGWMRGDSRRRGIALWPYVIATLVLGSVGVLAYLVRRGASGELTPRPGT